jgi:hypothetical protein
MNMRVSQDLEHLKILAICFYVKAGLTLLAGIFVAIYFMFIGGIFMSIDIKHKAGEPDPAMFGGFFIVIGIVVALVIALFAFLEFYAGRSLAKHKNYSFCFVIAVLSCLSLPLGTVLGIFTIIVLVRDSVKAIFSGQGFQQFNSPPPPANWQ